MTELSFLIDLFLIPDIPCTVRDMLVKRIKEVEANLTVPRGNIVTAHPVPMPIAGAQAPSTLAAMARHGEVPPLAVAAPLAPPEPVAVIAQTPATAAAMQARNDSINAALSGKTDKTTGRPRKW